MNIAFDLDGTLIDSAPDIRAVVNKLLGELGKPELQLTQVRAFIGEGSAVLIQRVMAACDISAGPQTQEELLLRFLSHYETMVGEAAFYPGVSSVLNALKADGYRLGLCTNKAEGPTRAVLAHKRLDSFFDAIMAGDMIDSRKPEPDMLLTLAADLGGDPLLYVGDSETDAETAQRARTPFALFSGGYRKSAISSIPHDWVFDSFSELPAIVAQAEG